MMLSEIAMTKYLSFLAPGWSQKQAEHKASVLRFRISRAFFLLLGEQQGLELTVDFILVFIFILY